MFDVFRSLLSTEAPPTKVLKVRPDSYSKRHIYCREDGLVLYEPQRSQDRQDKFSYEVVLHRPCSEAINQAYSLFRSEEKDEAEVRFLCLKDKVPLFIKTAKDMCNVQGLQSICYALAENPTWTLAHLAARFAQHDVFGNTQVHNQRNSADSTTGMSPLQVAIAAVNLKTVEMLVAAKCSLEHLDHQSNSVFHYAASTNKDIIAALLHGCSSRHYLNVQNRNGHTPLHLACLEDNPECVKALLLAGADVNISHMPLGQHTTTPCYVNNYLQDKPGTLYRPDLKFGGTPLHWACTRAAVESLLNLNCNINAVNFEQRTALHMMVLRGRLECVVALMTRQADPDVGDHEGNTALHLAVKQGNIPIMQCLIVFGANLDLVNGSGHTPRHLVTREQEPKLLCYLHAVGAKRCLPETLGCTEGCRFGGTYNGQALSPVGTLANCEIINQMLAFAGRELSLKLRENGPTRKGRLLCLDGGGVRGLILIQMLLELEKVVGAPLDCYFDWVAGTGTGGILALLLASGKTMTECLQLYYRMKEHLFVGMRPNASEVLDSFLKDAFGPDSVIGDINEPKVLVAAALADRKPVELHLFRNYHSPNEILNVKQELSHESSVPPEQQLLWHVGRAAIATPTFFRAFGHYVDEGLIASNPTLDALAEIHKCNLALKAAGRESEVCPVTVVVSLGTGLMPATQMKHIDVFPVERISDIPKIMSAICSLATVFVDQATTSYGSMVDRARTWCSMIGVPYFRFSPQLSEKVAVDTRSDEILCKMLWETKAYMHANFNIVKEVAEILSRN